VRLKTFRAEVERIAWDDTHECRVGRISDSMGVRDGATQV
jgi:hypothetical protein